MNNSDLNTNDTSSDVLCFLFKEDGNNVKCDAILGCRRVVAIISMLCSLTVISIIILFKKYKIFPQRLIMYLSIAAFFQAIGYVMGDYRINDDNLPGFCVFQGVWVTYFDWCSFLSVVCITFNVFWNAYFLRKSDRFEKIYILISWCVPLIISVLPFIESSYGPAGLWCWIRSTKDGEKHVPGRVMQFTLYYVPFMVLSILLIIAYILIIFKLRKRAKRWRGTYDPTTESEKLASRDSAKQLYLFPWMYIIIFIFPFMNRFRLLVGYSDDDEATEGARFFFWFMHSVTLPAHGTLYALAFGLDKNTMSRLHYNEIKAAAMAWMHKTVIKEYEMNDGINQQHDSEKYHKTEAYSSDKFGDDTRVSSPSTNSQMSEP